MHVWNNARRRSVVAWICIRMYLFVFRCVLYVCMYLLLTANLILCTVFHFSKLSQILSLYIVNCLVSYYVRWVNIFFLCFRYANNNEWIPIELEPVLIDDPNKMGLWSVLGLSF